MNALIEWLSFLGFMGIFSLAFGFYMMNRKRMLWRKDSKPVTAKSHKTIPSESDSTTHAPTKVKAVA